MARHCDGRKRSTIATIKKMTKLTKKMRRNSLVLLFARSHEWITHCFHISHHSSG